MEPVRPNACHCCPSVMGTLLFGYCLGTGLGRRAARWVSSRRYLFGRGHVCTLSYLHGNPVCPCSRKLSGRKCKSVTNSSAHRISASSRSTHLVSTLLAFSAQSGIYFLVLTPPAETPPAGCPPLELPPFRKSAFHSRRFSPVLTIFP